PRWYEAWSKPARDPGAVLGPFTWVTFPPQVRTVRAPAHRVPWHQDAGYQRRLGARAHRQVLTCFVPLDDDPASRATIQFAAAPEAELAHAPLDGFGAGIAAPPLRALTSYALTLGDALVFGDLVLHRTFVPAGAVIERRSLEFRLVHPADALDAKDYFDLASGAFVRRDGLRRVAPCA
ncbi:MAG: hypothetical protein ACREQL_09900, partial [Candidatus Binatia bacterium]